MLNYKGSEKMFKIYDGRENFYQWDLNRKLIVEDSSIKEVHFCNRTGDCSLVCEVYTDNGLNIADVPNIILQQSYTVNVYAYDGESTRHSASFEVKPRTKPADYIYTETEIKRYDDLEEKIAEVKDYSKTRYILNTDRGPASVGLQKDNTICTLYITVDCNYYKSNKKLNIPFNYDIEPVTFDTLHITNIDDFKPMLKNSVIGKGLYTLDHIAKLVEEYYNSYSISYSTTKHSTNIILRYKLDFIFANSDICHAFYIQFFSAIDATEAVVLEYTKPIETNAEYITVMEAE
jgi:hypothetical protein